MAIGLMAWCYFAGGGGRGEYHASLDNSYRGVMSLLNKLFPTIPPVMTVLFKNHLKPWFCQKKDLVIPRKVWCHLKEYPEMEILCQPYCCLSCSCLPTVSPSVGLATLFSCSTLDEAVSESPWTLKIQRSNKGEVEREVEDLNPVNAIQDLRL